MLVNSAHNYYGIWADQLAIVLSMMTQSLVDKCFIGLTKNTVRLWLGNLVNEYVLFIQYVLSDTVGFIRSEKENHTFPRYE